MDERAAVRWLHRRAGLGLPLAELDAAEQRGFEAELTALFSGDSVAAAVAAEPWDDAALPFTPRDRDAFRHAIGGWLDHLVATTTPGVDRMAWLWHGHFVSGLDKVRVARLMVDQIRLFRRAGLGSFRALLHDVTIDPAMLVYLDGAGSSGDHPNENYSREVLELFSIGLGQYLEDDVQAGASALSGWVLRRGEGTVQFAPRRHDDTARTYLGRDGVHDLDTVVDAIVGHQAMPAFVTTALAIELLGHNDASTVAQAAAEFVASDFDVAALCRALLRLGAAGQTTPVVLGPVHWLAIAQRVTGAVVPLGVRLQALRAAGQIPLAPPNVAGWPGGVAWFGSAAIVARARLAAAVSAAAHADGPAMAAASAGDLAALASALGVPGPFGDATVAALDQAAAGEQRLALALCSPEFVLA